ncbi:MAG: hypothetical protein V2B18_21805 [Pseudomonadota bacterium]
MKTRSIVPTLLAAAAFLILPVVSPCHAEEERFGPWVYFAPYYFPGHNTAVGACLTPEHFEPLYEVDNPRIPGQPMPMVAKPPTGMRKVKESYGTGVPARPMGPPPHGALVPETGPSPLHAPQMVATPPLRTSKTVWR